MPIHCGLQPFQTAIDVLDPEPEVNIKFRTGSVPGSYLIN